MAGPFWALLEPPFLMLGLFVVGSFQEFVELLSDREVVVLLRCVDGQLCHPISEHVLWIRRSHGVSVGLAVDPFPPPS